MGQFCVSGLLIDVASGGDIIKDYTPAFLLTLAFFLADIFVVSRIQVILQHISKVDSVTGQYLKYNGI